MSVFIYSLILLLCLANIDDASRKRKVDSIDEDDEYTLIGDEGLKIKRIFEHINPSVLELELPLDTLKKSNQSKLSNYLNDDQGSLRLIHLSLLESELSDDVKDLSLNVVNNIVSNRKCLQHNENDHLNFDYVKDDIDSSIEKSDTLFKPKFALHQRLPDGDYFTNSNSTNIDPQLISNLVTGQANAIKVNETIPVNVNDAPTLGDLTKNPNHQGKSFTQSTFKNKDVSHLYYGPNYSFGPSYDSSQATISYSASLNLASTSSSSTSPDENMIEIRGKKYMPNPEPTLDDDFDYGNPNFKSLFEEVSKSYNINQLKLKNNAFLLAKLKSLESVRLRSDKPHQVTDEELNVANQLIESFSNIIINEKPNKFYNPKLLPLFHPKPTKYSYYGTLNPAQPHMLIDNVSVKPSQSILTKSHQDKSRR